MNIVVRPMCLDDLDDVMEIELKCFATPWSRRSFEEELTKNNRAIYVAAAIGDKVVGYGGLWKIYEEGHITNIAVHPTYRRMKVGSAIINALNAIAKTVNIECMTLEVRESNIAAQNLYRKFGFKVCGRRRHYYQDNGEDALIMWQCKDGCNGCNGDGSWCI